FALMLAGFPQGSLGAGLGLSAGPESGVSHRGLIGPQGGASLRIGDEVFGSASLDLGMPLLSFGSAPYENGFALTLPFGVASLGAGWRVIDAPSFGLGISRSACTGVGPNSGGDCSSVGFGSGVAPGVAIQWRLTQRFALTLRSYVAVSILPIY